jgi:hypothetical protein
MTTYQCAECHEPVECKNAEDGDGVEFVRSCDHANAGIQANLEVQLTGESKVE